MTLASLPLIERDLAEGRLVCPIDAPARQAPDYTLAINAERASDEAVLAFQHWITAIAADGPRTLQSSSPIEAGLVRSRVHGP